MEPIRITEKQLEKLVTGLYETKPGEKRESIINDQEEEPTSEDDYNVPENDLRNSASMSKMD